VEANARDQRQLFPSSNGARVEFQETRSYDDWYLPVGLKVVPGLPVGSSLWANWDCTKATLENKTRRVIQSELPVPLKTKPGQDLKAVMGYQGG